MSSGAEHERPTRRNGGDLCEARVGAILGQNCRPHQQNWPVDGDGLVPEVD